MALYKFCIIIIIIIIPYYYYYKSSSLTRVRLETQQLAQPFDFRLQLSNESRVRIFVDNRFAHNLLGAVSVSMHENVQGKGSTLRQCWQPQSEISCPYHGGTDLARMAAPGLLPLLVHPPGTVFRTLSAT